MIDYHVALSGLGALIGIVSFIPYFRDIVRGLTKPHVFSWCIWALLTGITFFIQVAEGGGIGAMVTGIETLCCGAVAIFAYTRGEKNITRSDWICFALAIIAIILWRLAAQPLAAVLLVLVADMLGYIPTFRKSLSKPHEETVSQYSLSAVHWVLGVAALDAFIVTTWLYPLWMALFDSVLVATLLIRRRQLARAIQ